MNKAQPWNINGVGADAREAAREVARRQGKSLGEWLHGVIADHAEDQGLAPGAIGGQERIEAVTARLERMGARPGVDHARRSGTRARPDPRGQLRRAAEERDLEDEQDDLPVRQSSRDRHADHRDDGDDLLESAIAAMERRSDRTERRTSQALASMAKLLEETQARREQEHDNVETLARKLGEIETNLSRRLVPSAENPIQTSLARLEARLDAIGKRGAAEAVARSSAAADRGSDDAEPIRRLEAKLNSILEAVQPPRAASSLHASPVAMAAAQAAPVAGRRSLGDAIADIARRQRDLEEPANDERGSPRGPVAPIRRPEAAESLMASLRGDMAELAAKVDEIRRDALLARARTTPRDDIDVLRSELGAMARSIGELAPRGSIEALEGSITALADRIELSREHGIRDTDLRPMETAVGDLRHSLRQLDPRQAIGGMEEELRRIGDKVDELSGHDRTGISRLHQQMEDLRQTVGTMAARPLPVERIEHQVAVLAERLDQVLSIERRGVPLEADTRHIEKLLHELGARFEAANSPGADHATLDVLQQQIEQLSHRFERSETGLSALPTLAASIRQLFSHLEETRASVESSAAQAARDALRSADDEGRRRAEPTIRAIQDDIEARTSSTLNTVHDMLGKVVERLATMEHEIADVRQRPATAQPAALQPAARQAPVARDMPAAREMPAPQATRPKAPVARPVIGDREIRLGGMEPRPGSAPGRLSRNKDAATETAQPDTSDEARRADFIAAARRAASTAQAEAAAAQRRAPTDKAARAGLLARSRDYVATHKRPMLMSFAAIIMALGVIALVSRSGSLGGGVELAAVKPAQVATLAPPPAKTAAAVRDFASGALTPSELPKASASLANPIPGSDPIQTGSIPSLPSFAAGASAPPSRPPLSRALVAAAEGGDAAAQYELATRYVDGRLVPRDMKVAASWFEKAANTGSAPAQYRLASLYEKGIGVTIDKVKARSLYTKAAETGNPRAMHNLAVLLADGDGHPDYAGAVGWFRKAAQYGVHDSQYNLAVLLARGLGAPQNFVQSYQWFAVAAAANDPDAEKKRDEVGLKLSANDLAVAKALSTAFQAKTPDPAAVDVVPPPGGWDGAPGASRLNSARSKISSL